MKRVRVVAFAVLCVCMAATASASAHLFHASSTGKLLGTATSNQVFTTAHGEVVCSKAATTGTVTQLLGLHQLVEVAYSGCTAFGIVKVDISPALYLLSADGLAANTNAIKILVLGESVGLGECTITVHPQNLGTVKYNNSNGTDILEESAVHSIKSLSTGEPCGPAGESGGGTYTGNSLVTLDGGTIGWS